MKAARLKVQLLFLLLSVGQCALADIAVMDDAGRRVHLPAPAQRIVSLAPHITENLFSAGAGARIVGTVDYADYPPAALDIPRVGGYAAWDFEQLLKLRPDLVVLWGSGNAIKSVRVLQRLGLKVYVDEPTGLQGIARSLRNLGQLAGTADTANLAADRLLSGLAELQKKFLDQPQLTVYYQIDPASLRTVNGQQFISKIIRLCGGRNVFASASMLAPLVDIEAILRADPQVIVTGVQPAGEVDWHRFWARWPQLRAVQEQALGRVEPDLVSRPTVRLLEGAVQFCQLLDGFRVNP